MDNEMKEQFKLQAKINKQHNINFTLLCVYIIIVTTILLIQSLRINGYI